MVNFVLFELTPVQFLIEFLLFVILMFVGIYLKKIPKIRFFNIGEYFPKDEIHTLTQVAYLALMTACFVNVMYTLIYVNINTTYFAILNFSLSLFIAITIDKSTFVRKLFIVVLVPYGALTYLLFNSPLIGLVNFIQVPVFIYLIKHYYDKFMDYTESHGLGISIVLLFTIIFVSFLITSIIENKNPLDAIVMVSNTFATNGYTVYGTSDIGKVNNLVLAWMSVILPAVGTATLTSAILTRHYNKKLKDYDDKLDILNNKYKEYKKSMDEMEKLIKDDHEG